MARLKFFSNAGMSMGAESLMNLVEKWSWPEELLFFRLIMVSFISFSFNLYKRIEWGAGGFRYFLCSLLLWLVKLVASLAPTSLKNSFIDSETACGSVIFRLRSMRWLILLCLTLLLLSILPNVLHRFLLQLFSLEMILL